MNEMNLFNDPLKQSITGFDFKTKTTSYYENLDHSLGFESPFTSKNARALIHEFAEIDLKQI